MALVWLCVAPVSAGTTDGLRLMMLDQAWCEYCEQWDTEIGVVYAITDEGRAAPLIRQHIDDPLPDGVSIDRPARYTPTFVLLCAGREVGRIEGYPGEDFFWGLLGRMMDTLHASNSGENGAEGGAACDAQS